MKTIDKVLTWIGFLLVMVFGCAMDSESMVIPVIGVLIGGLLILIGEIRCSFAQR